MVGGPWSNQVKSKITKSIIGALLFIAVAGFAGTRIWQAYEKKAAAEPKKGGKGKGGSRIITVGVDRARTGSVRDEIMITGSLKPKEQVDITAKGTGRVEKLYFHVGDTVKRGDLIAEMEDAELQQQVNRALASLAVVRASLAQREAEFTNAKADVERSRTLLEAGLIPRQDYESRQTAFQVVEAQVQLAKAQEQQAQAELNELRIRLQQTRVYAPMDGHISRRYVDEGALVSPATPIAQIVNLYTMVTLANVPEREIGKLRVGNRAIVSVDAFGDRKFTGQVARISPVLDAATRSVSVEVEIPNRDGSLRAEMFARVQLDLGTMREAVLVPRESLVYRGQQPGVYVMQANRPVFRPVDTGAMHGTDVEILGSITTGTEIVSRGASMLTEGDQIRVAGSGREGGANGWKNGNGEGEAQRAAAPSGNGVNRVAAEAGEKIRRQTATQ